MQSPQKICHFQLFLLEVEDYLNYDAKKDKDGNIPILQSGETYTIKSGLVVGFGPAEIIINVAGVIKKVNCFILGPFVLNISE